MCHCVAHLYPLPIGGFSRIVKQAWEANNFKWNIIGFKSLNWWEAASQNYLQTLQTNSVPVRPPYDKYITLITRLVCFLPFSCPVYILWKGSRFELAKLMCPCHIVPFAVSFHICFNLYLKVVCELAKSSTAADNAYPASAENDAIVPQEMSHHMNSETEDTAGASGDQKANRGTVQSFTAKYYDQDCSECHITRRDPTPSELTMCLHALSYKASTLVYNLEMYINERLCTSVMERFGQKKNLVVLLHTVFSFLLLNSKSSTFYSGFLWKVRV